MQPTAGAGYIRHSHAMGRIAGGFDWASQIDKMYGGQGGSGLYQKAAFTSQDANINNRAYGQVLWQQANTATPLWGLLPKIPGDEADVNIHNPRPVTYRAVFNPPSMSSPREGSETVWDTSEKFDSREVACEQRHSTILFESTLIQQLLADIQDGVPFENLTEIGEDYFQRSLEVDGIARPVESSGDTGNGVQYAQDTTICSLDRVIASADEEANATDANGTAYADGDLDVYNIDRSDTGNGGDNEANWADSVVNHNGANGTRQLTKDVMNETITALEQAGVDRTDIVIYTGTDTARVLSELREGQFRMDALANAVRSNVSEGAEGETRLGHDVNMQVSHWDGVPIVQGPNCPSDDLSRIFLLDMSTMNDPVTGEAIPKLGIETYIPLTVETAGLGQATNTLATGELKEKQGLLTTHEVKAHRFNHQGKIRDLAE